MKDANADEKEKDGKYPVVDMKLLVAFCVCSWEEAVRLQWHAT